LLAGRHYREIKMLTAAFQVPKIVRPMCAGENPSARCFQLSHREKSDDRSLGQQF